MLHGFFSESGPAVRTYLGHFLIASHPDEDTGDPVIEAAILLNELTEAVDLLRTLASDAGEATPAKHGH